MELLVTLSVGVLVAGGTFLLLRPRTFSTILGLALLSYAANLFLFSSSYVRTGLAPLVDQKGVPFPDPLPQALVLTAIVISFGMTAFVVVLSLRAYYEMGSDHVDGVHAPGETERTDPRSGGVPPGVSGADGGEGR